MIVIILAGIGALWLAIAVMAVATVAAAAALARRRDGRDDIEALVKATREDIPDYVPAEWVSKP